MSIHDAFLDLAATSIDFELDGDERQELDRHLAGCDACRRTAAAFRDDAATIAFGTGPDLSPSRSEAILAAALRPPGRGPSPRLLGVGALVAVVAVGLAIAALALPGRPNGPAVAAGSGAGGSSGSGPSGAVAAPSGSPAATAGGTTPPASPVAGALPVAGDGQEIGTDVRMAPGPGHDLYVSIPAPRGTTLARLGADGKPTPGWPIVLPGASPCGLLLATGDGSVRLVCNADDLVSEITAPPVRAFAFDADGRPLPGWPVDLPCCFTGRVIGDDLVMYVRQSVGDVEEEGQPAGNAWIVTVAPDGTISQGAQVPFPFDCCNDTWAIGPDGVAYGTNHQLAGPAPTSELSAVSLAGLPSGFPVKIDGVASGPSFDASGRIHLTIGSPAEPPARTLVFGGDGGAAGGGSDPLSITATSDWRGAGGDVPAAPLVGPDGTTFVIDDSDRTIVAGLGQSGQPLPGWPYRSNLRIADTGFCGAGETGCGSFRAAPTVGPDNVLYILQEAAKASAGGSVVAIDVDGRVHDGWPVRLRRPGSEFWSVAVGPDGSAYALAIEPEPNGRYSATIVAIAPNSKVDYTATIIEP